MDTSSTLQFSNEMLDPSLRNKKKKKKEYFCMNFIPFSMLLVNQFIQLPVMIVLWMNCYPAIFSVV